MLRKVVEGPAASRAETPRQAAVLHAIHAPMALRPFSPIRYAGKRSFTAPVIRCFGTHKHERRPHLRTAFLWFIRGRAVTETWPLGWGGEGCVRVVREGGFSQGSCSYGARCLFAHGPAELRCVHAEHAGLENLLLFRVFSCNWTFHSQAATRTPAASAPGSALLEGGKRRGPCVRCVLAWRLRFVAKDQQIMLLLEPQPRGPCGSCVS